MSRSILTCVFIAAVCASLSAQQDPQQTSPSDPYQGVSIRRRITPLRPLSPNRTLRPRPSLVRQASGPALTRLSGATDSRSALITCRHNPNSRPGGNDDWIVTVAPSTAPASGLYAREASDPDGDIVHPNPSAPGELPPGAMIRVHLLTRLSTGKASAATSSAPA